jgi:diguanylate cyclase (GGDEF)-like protein/PAS domain S-box-containing protein
MRAAMLPPDEPRRLAALRDCGVLDSAPEECFDRATRLLATLTGMPTATIGFVDAHREWFKSRVGTESTAIARRLSFGAHAILADAPLVVHDTRADPRFHTNPLVTATPGVRFYAGAPLRTPEGLAVGVLCAVDHRPRSFDAFEIGVLADLAALVSAEIAARLAARRLARECDRRADLEAERAAAEQRLGDMLETATDWLWETDSDHRFTYVSGAAPPSFADVIFLGRRREEFAATADAPDWEAHHADLAARRPFRDFRYAVPRAGGGVRHIETSGKPVFEAGHFRGYRGTGRDVTAAVEAQAALREMSAKLQALQTSGVIGVIACRGDRIVDANAEFLRLVDRDRADLDAGRLTWSGLTASPAREPHQGDGVDPPLDHPKPFHRNCLRRDGTVAPVSVSSFVIDPATRHWMALVQDVSEQKAREAQIRELAYRDTLTGLLNRRSFNEHLGRSLRKTSRGRAARGALLLLDLDHFKDVNDAIGHDAGDALLRQIGRRLRQGARDGDVVARLGGDEFAVILKDIDDAAGIAACAHRLLETLTEPLMHEGQVIHPGVSIGVALFPRDGSDPAQLIKNADLALYRSKETGRRSVSFFDAGMMDDAAGRLRLVNEVRLAMTERQFRLAFQPIIALADGALVGFEALLRWAHPQRGLVAPGEFLDAIEAAGLKGWLARFTLDTAARQIRAWLDQGLEPGILGVNMTAAQIKAERFADEVAAVLAATGVAPARLLVEVTERVVIADDPGIAAALDRLHAAGTRIALDDFGTGYSSLVHLKRFPVDILKIDRSFVSDLEGESENTTIARAIVNLAHSLGMRVVAEGIESEAQFARLQALGCDFGQGYLIGAPVSADAATRWLAGGASHTGLAAGDAAPGG